MNILIFGATGGTGRELVKQALELGHQTTALVRNPDKFTLTHANLTVLKGDILKPETLAPAVKGQDAVLSALGTTNLGVNTIISDGTKNIIHAMESVGVKRFIVETTFGLAETKPYMNFLFGWIVVPFILKNVFADKEVQERYIMQSSLEWTIVRPTGLTNGAKTGVYQHGFKPDAAIRGTISRADVAEFMLKQVSGKTYLRQAASISY